MSPGGFVFFLLGWDGDEDVSGLNQLSELSYLLFTRLF